MNFMPMIGTALWDCVEKNPPYQRGQLPVFAAGICRRIGSGI